MAKSQKIDPTVTVSKVHEKAWIRRIINSLELNFNYFMVKKARNEPRKKVFSNGRFGTLLIAIERKLGSEFMKKNLHNHEMILNAIIKKKESIKAELKRWA